MASEKLPILHDENKNITSMQTQWKAKIDPVISNVANNSSILTKISLVNGSNTVDHKLGKKLTGWYLVRQRAAANVHDNQDNNQDPSKTLILVSDASVVVDICVF